MTRRFVFHALALALAAWAGTAAQAAPTGRTIVLVSTGDTLPGLEPGTVLSRVAGPLTLSEAGALSFIGTVAGKEVTTRNDAGYWRNDSLVAREGAAVDGLAKGETLFGFNPLGGGNFVGFITGPDPVQGNEVGLWTGSRLLVRTGTPIGKDAAGRAVNGQLTRIDDTWLSRSGALLYAAPLQSANHPTDRPLASLWRDGSLLRLGGEAAPGVAGSFTAFLQADSNAAGEIAFIARHDDTSLRFVDGISGFVSQEGVWRGQTLLARAGGSAAAAGEGQRFMTFSGLSLADNGQVAYSARVTSRGSRENRLSIWRDTELVALSGSTVTVDGQVLTLGDPLLHGTARDGAVVYSGQVSNNAGTQAALWRDQTVLARGGQASTAEGLQGLALGSLSFRALAGGGQVLMQAQLLGSGVTASNDSALVLTDGIEQLLVARTGDAVGLSDVVLRLGDATVNDHGQVAYQTELTKDKTNASLFTPTLRWRSSADGRWDDTVNWTLGLNPAAVHDVAIDTPNSLHMTGPTGAVTLKSLQIGTGTGTGLVALQMAGGSIGAADPIVIGQRGLLSGTGSFSRLVINQGTVQADRLAMTASLSNAGLVRGTAGGPRTGAGLEADLLNQASGRVLVQPGETLQLRGASHRNLGVFEINQGRLELTGTLLNGSGGIVDLNRSTTLAEGAWTNAAGARILLGDARLTVSKGLTNAGQVLVTSGDSDVFGAVTNQKAGQIILSGQGTTTFYDAVELQAGSELRTSAGATAVFFGTVAQRSGALMTGTGHKYFEGGFSVGNSPGLGEDAGNVAFGLGNVYLAEIGGTALGTGYDHYRVAGTLTLGGTLRLVSFAGFTGQAGQRFDLFDWGTLQGRFSHIDSSGLQLTEGTVLDLSRLYSDGVIGVTAVPEPGSWALMLAGLAGLGLWRGRSTAVRRRA